MKRLIILIDSGDTLVDEASQEFDENGYVTRANWIPGAQEFLDLIYEQGYTIALVADGELKSFQNIYRENSRAHCFQTWVISEVVGQQKPAKIMFETAMKQLGLNEEDKNRIVMIGNNLKKDIAGANQFGITSIWLDWSPRYYHNYEESNWIPDYSVKEPKELIGLIRDLNAKLNSH